MKKEVLFAVILGSILGLVVAFGIWRANASFGPESTENIADSKTSPTPQALASSTNGNLSITKPEHNEVLVENTTAVSGITKANSFVVVYLNEEYIVKSDSTGTFSMDVELEQGINHILVKTFDPSYQLEEKRISVVYDPNVSESANSQEGTNPQTASDSVREKIQQKLEQVSSKPQAIIGTVTDKTSSGFNLRNGGSEIKQVTIVENQTLIIKSGQTDKTIPFSDLAIGDFVAAIGYKTSAGALEAMRVLVDNAKPDDNYKIFIAQIDEVTRQNITLLPKAGITDAQVVFRISSSIGFQQLTNNTLTTIKSTTLTKGDILIVSATQGTNALTVENVYLIESSSPAPTPAR